MSKLVWKKAKMSLPEILICIACGGIIFVIVYALLNPRYDEEKKKCIESGKVVKDHHYRGSWTCDDK